MHFHLGTHDLHVPARRNLGLGRRDIDMSWPEYGYDFLILWDMGGFVQLNLQLRGNPK